VTGLDLPPGERAARVAWARLAEPADPVAAELVRAVGAEQALHIIDPGSTLAARIASRLELLDVRRDFDLADRVGARIIIPGDPEWPHGLLALANPPYCLWVRGPGDLATDCARSVSLVGARAATGYGVHQAKELAGGLADRDFAVVSGAAYGIDGAAHEGALALDGVTVAVVAGGVERPYPAGHTQLLTRIAESGLVVSEVPPGSAPTRWRFLSRNRLIATLSQGTVVVEAGLRSGSRNTARQARDHHRVVCAVPGPVSSAVSAGCHELIREGATLVTDAAEVAEEVGSMGELAPRKRGAVQPEDDLDPVHRVVLAALPFRGAVPVDEVARRSGVAVAEAIGALGVLTLQRLAVKDDAGYRKTPRKRTA
jgi:DNA processing protein